MPPTAVFFDVFAAAYDLITDHRYWQLAIGSALDRAGDLSGVRRVLDLGCGPGVSTFALAERLPHAEIVGVDIAAGMIARAHRHLEKKRTPRVSFEVADATRMKFDAGSFDLALGHSFLYLVGDRRAVLAEVRRVVAPGGTLALLEPNEDGGLWRAAWSCRQRAAELVRAPWSAARFVASMCLWRLVSGVYGRLREPEVRALLGERFADVRIEPALGGLGLHCFAR